MEKLLTSVYKNRKLSAFLKAFSVAVSLLCVLLFGFIIGYFIYLESYLKAALLGASAFVGFVAVTLMRKLIDAPRPYELYSFYEIAPKEREGNSFPSRHAYSAFCIAVLSFSVHPVIAAAFIFLAALMCAARVLVGIHFIRDVSAGAVIGALAGVIGLLL